MNILAHYFTETLGLTNIILPEIQVAAPKLLVFNWSENPSQSLVDGEAHDLYVKMLSSLKLDPDDTKLFEFETWEEICELMGTFLTEQTPILIFCSRLEFPKCPESQHLPVVITYSPYLCEKNPAFKKEVWKSFQKLLPALENA